MKNKEAANTDRSLFYNGQWHSGKGKLLTSDNPSTGGIVWQKHRAKTDQVSSVVRSAHQASLAWSLTEKPLRINIIRRFSALLKENKKRLAVLLSQENGKPLWEAIGEINACIAKADISITAEQERCPEKLSGEQQLHYKAIGVMLVIGPYNFPFHLPNGHIIPALLAGNCILFKPSEQTPACAEAMIELWHQAGIPPGVINLIQGGAEIAQALIGENIDAVLFTGSSDTGIAIHRSLAGRPQVLLALEMGGNNPLIIDTPSTDYTAEQQHKLVDLIIRSAFISSGQRCTCCRRLIVINCQQNQKLLKALEERCKEITVGQTNGEERPVFIGPLISKSAANHVREMYKNLINSGALPLLPLQDHEQSEALLYPAIVDMNNVDKNEITDREIFGPLLQLYRVNTFGQAINLANQTEYGLAAGLVSENIRHQEIFFKRVRAGFSVINKPTTGAPSNLPFGGSGLSGNHRPSAYYAADYCAWPASMGYADNVLTTETITQAHHD